MQYKYMDLKHHAQQVDNDMQLQPQIYAWLKGLRGVICFHLYFSLRFHLLMAPPNTERCIILDQAVSCFNRNSHITFPQLWTAESFLNVPKIVCTFNNFYTCIRNL